MRPTAASEGRCCTLEAIVRDVDYTSGDARGVEEKYDENTNTCSHEGEGLRHGRGHTLSFGFGFTSGKIGGNNHVLCARRGKTLAGTATRSGKTGTGSVAVRTGKTGTDDE